MKRLALISLMMFVVVGCKGHKVNGTLTVDQEITLKGKNGYNTLERGDYLAKLIVSGKRKLKLKTENDTFTFKTAKGVQVPRSGNFEVEASNGGDAYVVNATRTSEVLDTRNYRAQETCTVTVPVTICYGGRYNHGCHTDYRTEYRQRVVEFEEDLIANTLEVAITDDVSFKGQSTERTRRYTYVGPCPSY